METSVLPFDVEAARRRRSSTPQAEPPAPVTVRELAPDDYARWDDYVRTAPDGTIHHTIAWMIAVRDTFGHKPMYLVAQRGHDWAGVLPLFRIKSLFGGTMLVSVPYAVYGGIAASDEHAVRALLRAAFCHMERERANCIDLRSVKAADPDLPVNDRYLTFRRDLPDRPGDVLGKLPRKARAAARNARNKFGLTVEFDDKHLSQVWRLYCRSMQRLGSLNYPYSFFQRLIDETPDGHLVSLIRYENRPIAGLVTFLFNGVCMPYFVGCDARYNHTGVNNFIYLTVMERAVELGCRTFDFGRSRRDNTGCCNFKTFQGFEPQVMQYQCVVAPGRTAPDLTPSNPRFGLARKVWPRLPLRLTRPLGAWLSRHVPG
ncbi:MAG: FemAB family PEP-CTERM system-associated protein [Phycisphaerales bacterium]|nr:MAG: FemAB family PEP-CTERM system-associated protein [Phycisphaerales bacterium]